MSGTAAPGPPLFVEVPSTAHYRVEVQAGSEGCTHCHQGALYTIVSGEGEEETEIGSAWGDLELTEDICDLMNMAYNAGEERLAEGIRTAVKGCAACGGQGFEYVDDGTGEDVTGEPCKECFDLRELIGDHTNYQQAQQAIAEPFPPAVPEPWEPCTLVPQCSLSKGHEGDCIDFPF